MKNNDLINKIKDFKVVARDILQRHLIESSFKFNIFLIATFQKALEPDILIQAHFNKGRGRGLKIVHNQVDIEEYIDEECNGVVEWVEMYANRASNFILKTVDQNRYYIA